jgi:hypothetical protein
VRRYDSVDAYPDREGDARPRPARWGARRPWVLAGTLPTGIALSPSGTLSGSTSQIGSFPFTVGVVSSDTTKPVLTARLSGTPGTNN